MPFGKKKRGISLGPKKHKSEDKEEESQKKKAPMKGVSP